MFLHKWNNIYYSACLSVANTGQETETPGGLSLSPLATYPPHVRYFLLSSYHSLNLRKKLEICSLEAPHRDLLMYITFW